jgi:carboxyvinyl-carboxyphosphonate phosphorylmutase
MPAPYLTSAEIQADPAARAHPVFQAAVQAVYATMKALREGADPTTLAGLPSSETMRRVTRADDYAKWTKHYLK